MKLVIKQKFISILHQRFDVLNEEEKILYTVKPCKNLFKKHQIFDENEKLLGYVKKRYCRVFARNDILNADKKIEYIIKRKFTIFTKSFKVINKTGSQDKFSLSGNIFAWNFELRKNDQVVAEYEKKIIALTDTFKINILDENYTTLAIGIAVSLDNALRDGNKRLRF